MQPPAMIDSPNLSQNVNHCSHEAGELIVEGLVGPRRRDCVDDPVDVVDRDDSEAFLLEGETAATAFGEFKCKFPAELLLELLAVLS